MPHSLEQIFNLTTKNQEEQINKLPLAISMPNKNVLETSTVASDLAPSR